MNAADIIQVFGKFVESLNLPNVLPFRTGLSAVIVILCALLVLIALLRRKAGFASYGLVGVFGIIAVGLVLIDVYRPDREDQPTDLVFSAASNPDLDAALQSGQIKLFIAVGGNNFDVFEQKDHMTKVNGERTDVVLNTTYIMRALNARSEQVNVLTRRIGELAGPASRESKVLNSLWDLQKSAETAELRNKLSELIRIIRPDDLVQMSASQ